MQCDYLVPKRRDTYTIRNDLSKTSVAGLDLLYSSIWSETDEKIISCDTCTGSQSAQKCIKLTIDVSM